MKKLSITELNNLHLEELEKLEDEAFDYYKKVRRVKQFALEVEKEE